MRKTFDWKRPAIIPVFVEGVADRLYDLAIQQDLKIAKIEAFVEAKIFICDISPADNGDLIVDHHGLVVHAVIQSTQLPQIEQLPRYRSAGTPLKRVENTIFDIWMFGECEQHFVFMN